MTEKSGRMEYARWNERWGAFVVTRYCRNRMKYVPTGKFARNAELRRTEKSLWSTIRNGVIRVQIRGL